MESGGSAPWGHARLVLALECTRTRCWGYLLGGETKSSCAERKWGRKRLFLACFFCFCGVLATQRAAAGLKVKDLHH